MNTKFSLFLASIFLLILSMFSCVPRSSYTLLYDMKPDTLYSAKYAELSKVKVGDRIGIVVRAQNPELAKPFNSINGNITIGSSGIDNVIVDEPNYGTRQIEVERGVTSSRGEHFGGFLVSEEGFIMYPILGKIYVKGLTLPEVSTKIKDLIVKGGYINDPVVETAYTDFRVYFINGTSGSVYDVGNERLNIIQAVTKGMQASTSTYRVDHIAVIRQNEDGKSQIYFCNLLNTDIFNSPVFYLQPGDIVYMQPKSQPAETVDLDNIFRYTSYIFTTIFTVTSILNIFNK